MTILNEPISQLVWDLKYRYRRDGQIMDQTIQDTWHRVAKAIAQVEKPEARAMWEARFYQILENFHFLPGGRILAGAGTKHHVTLFNCFVMDIAEDSLRGIFESLEEGALTLQQGGGIGYDFSVLRPEGALVKKTGVASSGPVSFMRIWDTTCKVLLSTGARRGAMMAVLRCDHPDVETFITAKKDPLELRHFNVSVMVTDAFMQAVKHDQEWHLVFPCDENEVNSQEIIYRQWGQSLEPVPCRIYRTIRARELWEKIIRSAYDYAEPGVLFHDTINRMNNLWYQERINATNPCGEIPLPPYGACNLGSINLTQFVISPFTSEAKIDWKKLDETVHIATRFLDNVIDASQYPLKGQAAQAFGSRRIGLGMTGLADVFVMLGMRYGSESSVALAREIMHRIMQLTWLTSIELAKEKGSFLFYKRDYLQGEFVKQLDPHLFAQIEKHGMRNSHHNTIAPTGTISLLANNVSNGIEPIFKAQYDRHVRAIDGSTMTFNVKDFAYQLWREKNNTSMPDAWVDTDDLQPSDHLGVQEAMQPFIDNAISKTINLPVNFPFEKLADVYTNAYEAGLKGCTVFRPNPITGSVLEVPEEHCGNCEGALEQFNLSKKT